MHSIASYSKSIAAITAAPSRMPVLIFAFENLTAELDACDHFEAPFLWDEIAARRCRALEALLDERPANVVEFADKFAALIPFTEEDTEFTALRVLADDIRALATEA